MTTTVLVGTVKGGFVLRSQDRSSWELSDPLFKGWKVTASTRLPSGRFLVATASDVYGPALHTSEDLATFQQVEDGPAWPKGGERKLNQIWKILPVGERVFAGVDEAGLFVADAGGEAWKPVEGLNEHATRTGWFPGAGGLCAHALTADGNAPERMWCGISAVGVFRTEDGGATWRARNEGVTRVIEDKAHKEIGFCVHSLQQDPEQADTIWRQDHRGMYRSTDGADSWESIENGLPSGFGFPLALNKRTRELFALPLQSDEYRLPIDGKLTVYKSTDRGDSWQAKTNGLPQEGAYAGVLRHALVADSLDPCGVYMGTTSGTLHVSRDAGESWATLPYVLPRILSVEVYQDA
jgi:hypothetical protein